MAVGEADGEVKRGKEPSSKGSSLQIPLPKSAAATHAIELGSGPLVGKATIQPEPTASRAQLVRSARDRTMVNCSEKPPGIGWCWAGSGSSRQRPRRRRRDSADLQPLAEPAPCRASAIVR
jgi:hypothetical protein